MTCNANYIHIECRYNFNYIKKNNPNNSAFFAFNLWNNF